jgi:hypothetical protein
MLLFGDGQSFATGKMTYEYRPTSQHTASNRLYLRVEINSLPLLAIVDTGTPYVIVQPKYARLLQLDPTEALEEIKLKIRGTIFKGQIHRVPVDLPASEGESMSLEATVFVPETDEESWGDIPSFLGMVGFLERIRFAIDPDEDSFYFGTLS